MQLYYKPRTGCPVHGDAIALSDGISKSIARGLDKQLQQLYQDIANDPSLVIHKDIFNYTRSQLHQGINQVFGSPNFDDPDFDLVQRLKANADRFAGYKSAWQTAHIRNVEPGQMPAINSSYNVNWMRTEYVHTVRSSRAAKNWEAIARDKDLYPFLEYMPSTAAEPRNEHQRLYGVIKPVDDPFWDTWMPPSDWGCRCSVKQVRNDEGAKQPPDDIKLPPATMRNNPGKSGQLFTDEHPMIKKVGAQNKDLIDNISMKIILPETRQAAMINAANFINQSFINNSNGFEIRVLKSGLKEAINQPHRYYIEKGEMIKSLDRVILTAHYLRPIVPKPSSLKDKNITRFHYYKIRSKTESYMVVKELSNGSHQFYSIVDKIKNE